jgi:Flp pilus assembly protein TadG
MRIIRGLIASRHQRQAAADGAAAVEFALVIPLLLLVLCGIFDLGNLYFQMDVVNQAARQGARLAAVNLRGSAQITSALQGSYGNQLTVSENPAAPVAGSNVTVTVTNNVTIMTPLISAFFSKNPYPVSGTCTMYVE